MVKATVKIEIRRSTEDIEQIEEIGVHIRLHETLDTWALCSSDAVGKTRSVLRINCLYQAVN